MTAAEYQAQHGRKSPPRPAKQAERASTPLAPPASPTARQIAKIEAARREAVGVGRLAWTNTTFGYPMPCRKYLLSDEAQAAELDKEFYRITNTQP